MDTNTMKKVEQIIKDFDKGYAEEYMRSLIEGVEEKITWDNYDQIVEDLNNEILYLNDCNDCGGTSEMLWSKLQDAFGWSGEEMNELWEDEIEDMWEGVGSCYSGNAYGIQAICYDMVENIVSEICKAHEEEMRLEKIEKAKTFSKDDVMKFLKEAGEGFDDEGYIKKNIWFRKDFKGKYERCDIAFVSSCDVRMEKIGKMEIYDEYDLLIDFVSADKMDDVNVDIDVVEMIDKIAV